MRFEEGKFQCTYIIPAGLKAFNLLYSLELQLFHERCSFSPPRLPPCGVPRCMGRSDGKRNAPLQSQTPCSPFPGLRRSGGTRRGELSGIGGKPLLEVGVVGADMDKGGFLVKPNISGLFLLRKPCSHKLSFLPSVAQEWHFSAVFSGS